MNPKVSLLIPIYDSAEYLSECLESIAAQEYQNWEAVLVDDGSRDGSVKICEQYARQDPRFVVVRHPKNSGPNAARETAFNNSPGELVCFVDSDDVLEPRYLVSLVEAVGDADFAWSDYCELWGEETRERRIYSEELLIAREEILDAFFRYGESRKEIGRPLWSAIYRRKCLDSIDWKLNDGEGADDILTVAQMLSTSTAGKLLPSQHGSNYIYRQREGSLIHSGYAHNGLKGVAVVKNWTAIFGKFAQMFGGKSEGAEYIQSRWQEFVLENVEAMPSTLVAGNLEQFLISRAFFWENLRAILSSSAVTAKTKLLGLASWMGYNVLRRVLA